MAMTPMKKIIRRGNKIYTVDGLDREELVSESPSNDHASWLLGSLRFFHKNTPVEESDD